MRLAMKSGLAHIMVIFTLALVACKKEPADSNQFKGILKFP